jgi:hypothetical protein
MAAVPPAALPVGLDPMIPPDVDFVLMMCGVGVTVDGDDPAARARVIRLEGLNSLAAFGFYTDEEIADMAQRNERRSPAALRVRMGLGHIKRLKAVSYWVKKARREGRDLDALELNPDLLDELMEEMSHQVTTKKDEKLFYPEKFEAKRYKAWSRSLYNYLDSIIGKAGVALTYVIRPEDVDPDDAVDEYQRVLYSVPHVGFAFRDDNRHVYRVLKDLIIGTDGWAWFNMAPEGNGRASFLRLEQHYLGTEHTARRAADAESRLRQLHYKHESALKFEDYITSLYEAFEMLEDNNQGWHDAQKVNKLLAGIQSNNPEIAGLKPLIRKEYPNDFEAAATQLAGQISLIYSESNNAADGRNKRRISAVDQNHHGGRGRQQRGGRNNGQNMINGVDVSNPNRNFSDEEWHRLRDSGMMAWIIARRNTNRQGQNRGQGRRGGGGRGNQGGGRNNNRAGRGYNGGNEHNRRVQIAGATVMGEENVVAGHAGNNVQQPAPARGGQHGARFGGRHPGGGRG